MATRFRSLMAALVTFACVAWLAQSRDMQVGESRLALDGPTPGDVEAHAPGSVAAPASRARTAVAPGERAGRVAVECFCVQPAATERVSMARRPLPTAPIDLVVDAVPVHVGALYPSGEHWQGRLGVLWRYERGWFSSMGGVSLVRIWVVRGEPYLVRVYGAGLYEPVDVSFPAITALERERAHDLMLVSALAGLRVTLRQPDGSPVPEDTRVELRSNRIDDNGQDSSKHAPRARFASVCNQRSKRRNGARRGSSRRVRDRPAIVGGAERSCMTCRRPECGRTSERSRSKPSRSSSRAVS